MLHGPFASKEGLIPGFDILIDQIDVRTDYRQLYLTYIMYFTSLLVFHDQFLEISLDISSVSFRSERTCH